MVTTSQRFEDGVLVERAIATDVAGDPQEKEAVTDRPNDEPEENSTFASRAKRGTRGKRVAEAEDKSVPSAQTKTRRAPKKR